MHRLIFLAGSLLASSIGVALAGLVLREAIRNSRPRRSSKNSQSTVFGNRAGIFDSRVWEIAVRGYDSPELQHDDTVARQRQSGTNRNVQ